MSSIFNVSPVEEFAAFLARRPSAAELATFHLSQPALNRVYELMDKNDNGVLTPDEGRELDRLILLDDIIGLIKTNLPPADEPETGE